jgi:hypothetical protein
MFTRGTLLFFIVALVACGVPTHPLTIPVDGARAFADDKKAAPAKILGVKPVTINVPVTDEQKDRLAGLFAKEKPRSVSLSLRGVRVPESWNPKHAVYVFVNNPDATADTMPDDASFVMAFTMSPVDPAEPQNFGFDLAPALNRLKNDKKWKPGEAIQVTFVIVPPANSVLPEDLKVPFEGVVLSVPAPR